MRPAARRYFIELCLQARRWAPTCSDIHVSQAGDDTRMPSAPPRRDRPEGP